MSDPVILKVVNTHLASILLPTGVTLPAPLIVLPNDTPLYDEPIVVEEFETALSNGAAPKVNGIILDLENSTSTLVTVTFSAENMETVYQLNVPRQLLQVGRMYNSLLNAPALSFLSESEIEGYTPETPLEELSTLFSDEGKSWSIQ